MKRNGLSLAVVSAALFLATGPVAFALEATANNNRQDCGWYETRGTMVFLGTCPNDTSGGSEAQSAPAPVK